MNDLLTGITQTLLMKNFQIRFIALFLLTDIGSVYHSFAQARKEYIILSGTIKNIEPQTDGKRVIELITQFGLKPQRKSIQLTEDGFFIDTIRSGSGEYGILDGKNPVSIYLNRSKKYIINYDADNFRNGAVKLGGDDVLINRYFITKGQKKVYIDRSNINRPEEEFRQEIGQIRKQMLDRLQTAKLPNELKVKEAKSIHYEYLSELYYFLLTKKEANTSFQPSSVSQKELNISYRNEDDYKQHGYYRKLVYEYYAQQLSRLEKKIKKTDPSYSLLQNRIKLLSTTVPNKYIKNDLIAQDALYGLKTVKDIEAYYQDFKAYYTGEDEEFKAQIADSYLRFSKLKAGTPSPEFVNYTNYQGSTTSLKDFRGKYVYIDLWATWCGNCWNEMPYLKQLEQTYEGRDIAFISISIDKNKNEWAKTIKRENMGGIQLLANQADTSFIKEYAVNGIPRYILLDPNGAIVAYSAPRPSETEALKSLFKSVGL